MALLYDMTGKCCGSYDSETPPEGFWIRADDAPLTLAPVDFLDKIGPTRFAAIWAAADVNPMIAFTMMRGFAAQSIYLSESFPALKQMESLGLLPDGTAVEVWT